jgi:ABC-type polysaccharide/polyol phosphate export permease
MTSLSLPAAPRSAAARAGRAIAESWTLAQANLRHWIAAPGQIVAELAFPVIFIVLFGYVFGSGIQVPGGGDYREFLMPGMFAQTMAFGIGATMAAIAVESARGITDRLRAMPISPAAVVGGRCLADMLNSVLSLIIMVACGLVVGWSFHNGLADALLAFGLLLLLRFAFLWIGIFLGLIAPNEAAVNALWGLLFPITMITSAFVSPDLMPGWLGTIAEWNPLSATITATRELFGNPGVPEDGSWVVEHALPMAVVWPVALTAVFAPLSVWRFRRMSR